LFLVWLCLHFVHLFTESPKEKTGGVAYDLILKAARTDSPRPPSPPKEKDVSLDEWQKKMDEAEERRTVCIFNLNRI
jgi:hypothetical protein